jgi:hypothetical protein
MRRIFISGPITPRGKRDDTDHPAIEYILNCRDMIEASNELIRRGWATYCPALDFLNFLLAGISLPINGILKVDLAWLEVSDAILMVGKWQLSKNSVKEYERALKLGLSIYYSLEEVPDERD